MAVGTIPLVPADAVGATDSALAALAGVRGVGDGVGIADSASAELITDPHYNATWGYPVFFDDFSGVDGSAPDAAKWYRRGLPGSDYYLSNTDRQGIIVAANAFVEGGVLKLKTERRSSPLTPDAYTRWYDTAYIDTMPRSGTFDGFEQRYGRWEARAHSLHPGDTAGLVPAFWIRTVQDGGEVDIFEWSGTPTGYNESGAYVGYANSSRFPISGLGSFSAFFESTGQTSNTSGNAYHESTWTLPTADDWHTYAMEWTPDRISCYRDDVLTVQIRRGYQPQYNNGSYNSSISDGALILDGGFGGTAKAHMRLSVHVGWPWTGYASTTYTASPHYFLFDYVAVYGYDGQE